MCCAGFYVSFYVFFSLKKGDFLMLVSDVLCCFLSHLLNIVLR